MADLRRKTDGPSPFDATAFDKTLIPDWDNDFIDDDDVETFANALNAPELASPSEEDLTQPSRQQTEFITALNDWKPVHQRVRGREANRANKGKKRRKPALRRGKDETREGWTYSVLKWPLFLIVLCWIIGLGILYSLTRLYIFLYERLTTFRGRRHELVAEMRATTNYKYWVVAARALDRHLGNEKWKTVDDYAYYDSNHVRRALETLKNLRSKVDGTSGAEHQKALDELRNALQNCVKNNFSGFENPLLYSETYYGTKILCQSFVDEVATCLKLMFASPRLAQDEKRALAKHLSRNFGTTALCLSGGATFAYYHLGLAKALLDAKLLPPNITGTSGGALIAALLGTRTDDELRKLLVPALAVRINACEESLLVGLRRWYKTGARYDSVLWSRKCAWFCRGSLTFAEAFKRTGRTVSVTCVPADPHTPSMLLNHLTAPDCVMWSAVLASAAVPGIINPVVLMSKGPDGRLQPYSFGRWRDGSLRTDVPIKSLNLFFNVNFSIVSQVNPHVNLFFFASRGSVGRPVTHRKGRGWRGGFLGSALEQYLKLDLIKWLKILRHLELLPRLMGQDWSNVWLQKFSGTITVWPKVLLSDFWYILSDPTPQRLARMIFVGQHAAFPKLNFIANRMKIENLIEEARHATRDPTALPTPAVERAEMRDMFSEKDLQNLLVDLQGQTTGSSRREGDLRKVRSAGSSTPAKQVQDREELVKEPASLKKKFSEWLGGVASNDSAGQEEQSAEAPATGRRRQSSLLYDLRQQSNIFFDDTDEGRSETEGDESADDGHVIAAPFESAQ